MTMSEAESRMRDIGAMCEVRRAARNVRGVGRALVFGPVRGPRRPRCGAEFDDAVAGARAQSHRCRRRGRARSADASWVALLTRPSLYASVNNVTLTSSGFTGGVTAAQSVLIWRICVRAAASPKYRRTPRAIRSSWRRRTR
jgi:hypothetical protein